MKKGNYTNLAKKGEKIKVLHLKSKYQIKNEKNVGPINDFVVDEKEFENNRILKQDHQSVKGLNKLICEIII